MEPVMGIAALPTATLFGFGPYGLTREALRARARKTAA